MASFKVIVPEAGVYLVKPASIAAIAACFICTGVSKSGSPAPKPTTSMPSAFSFFALESIASVADGLIDKPLRDKFMDNNPLKFKIPILRSLYEIIFTNANNLPRSSLYTFNFIPKERRSFLLYCTNASHYSQSLYPERLYPLFP